ncbi:polyamine aminopropyltransferase [Streptomyces alkaliphilus]|uniref:Polyamine aminopropyltransferase n=1 Tax=Streptomyces alkaliphilus TaxID=1472722 RepID=A0A7W3Y2S1_9ACTN|nr:polyamine aminopropyltransferase [Streptomyces alkaliphilus]MBB0245711.1 polyamine aminopropyltransferase [Streptomyces alkaliphilus]
MPRARGARFLLLLSVFVCAACGLVYELALVALGGYLIGNTVLQTSIVLSVMVFAMGVGSLAAKPLQRRAIEAFAIVEGVLALVGGLSVLLLYAAFAWLNIYTVAVVVIAFVVGVLIGAEIPLLMTMLQWIRRQDAGRAVADMFAVDYIGALLGGLSFPLLLLPLFGQIKGALVVGGVNAVAGIAVVLWIFRARVRPPVRAGLVAGMVGVLVVLAGAFALADRFEVTARQQLYRDPIAHAERTDYQEIVVTHAPGLLGMEDLRLFLNGDLQFSSVDEYRYHEALVHPALAGERSSVLIIGGGDALALREVLRYPDVESVTLVDLDPAMTDLAREWDPLVELNDNALADERVTVVNDDAFGWLREARGPYDVVITDLPDPQDIATAKLYSVEFYTLIGRVLDPDGHLVVQAGSPYFAPRTFWSIETGIREAGFGTTPYQVDVPSFGNWGYVLAVPGDRAPEPELAPPAERPELRFLDEAVLGAATVFPVDRRDPGVRASTLMHPVVLEYRNREWRQN